MTNRGGAKSMTCEGIDAGRVLPPVSTQGGAVGNMGSAGGRANALILRKAALERYYKSPNHCLTCETIITVPENRKVGEVRCKRFCNHVCAATYNNQQRLRTSKTQSPIGACQNCGVAVRYSLRKDGHAYFPRRYCEPCTILKKLNGRVLVATVTKGNLFKNGRNWQTARSMIQAHAQRVYLLSGQPFICKICGYSSHVDIAHNKAVSEFTDDTLVIVINRIENLVALCPNHHWEFDHRIITLEAIDKLKRAKNG